MVLLVQLLLLLTRSKRTDGYYLSWVDDCMASSPDLSDVVFLRSYYFNKAPLVQFNSTLGKFVGFGEFGLTVAEYWNHDPYVKGLQGEVERYCRPNLQTDYSDILDKTVKPRVELMSEKQSSGDHPALVMCSAYDFYPPAIEVYWLRDGIKVTTDVISTEEMADGDWYYQVHSHLEYTPKSGEKISCVVEHASSKEPIVLDWGESLPESERNKIAIGTSGLVMGIVLSAAGFLYYRKRCSGIL